MASSQVKVTSMVSWNYVFRSEVTERVYRFGPNETLSVDVLDCPSLLAIYRPAAAGCCGSQVKGHYYFKEN